MGNRTRGILSIISLILFFATLVIIVGGNYYYLIPACVLHLLNVRALQQKRSTSYHTETKSASDHENIWMLAISNNLPLLIAQLRK